MPLPRHHLAAGAEALEAGFAAIRSELDVPGPFDAGVVEAASASEERHDRVDRTGVELLTIDPPGSLDLDQALSVEPRPDGHRVWYAIADVATFIEPGGPVDRASHQRGQTLYSPDHRALLHPAPLSENRASLLPGADRPAVLWRLDVDDTGALSDVGVERAVVRSRARFTYDEAQRLADDGEAPLVALRSVGEARVATRSAQGAIHLDLPDQDVARDDGGYRLVYRSTLPVERWNAELSLLTGIAAARLMLDGGTGVLRTLPPAPPEVGARLRRTAAALGVGWPDGVPVDAFFAALRPVDPPRATLVTQAARLFRGAGYATFAGAAPSATDVEHAAIGGPYAHVTAPLRRLVDRYAAEACLATVGGAEPPEWVLAGLDEIPTIMGSSGSKASALERAVVDHVEAVLLAPRVGERFSGVVVDQRVNGTSIVQFSDPAVITPVEAPVGALGERVDIVLVEVDISARRVVFEPAT